jgi:hypothetical protein
MSTFAVLRWQGRVPPRPELLSKVEAASPPLVHPSSEPGRLCHFVVGDAVERVPTSPVPASQFDPGAATELVAGGGGRMNSSVRRLRYRRSTRY